MSEVFSRRVNNDEALRVIAGLSTGAVEVILRPIAIIPSPIKEKAMAKSQNAKKDVKKKSVKTLKEKRHDKKAKKEKR
ncbi:MAG: hypothetical protein ACYC4D_05885 [Thermoleophilia bacterium]